MIVVKPYSSRETVPSPQTNQIRHPLTSRVIQDEQWISVRLPVTLCHRSILITVQASVSLHPVARFFHTIMVPYPAPYFPYRLRIGLQNKSCSN